MARSKGATNVLARSVLGVVEFGSKRQFLQAKSACPRAWNAMHSSSTTPRGLSPNTGIVRRGAGKLAASCPGLAATALGRASAYSPPKIEMQVVLDTQRAVGRRT